ncbi:unnamed protein product, partial [Rotaria sordida]
GLKTFVDDDDGDYDKYLISINRKLQLSNEERTILGYLFDQSQYHYQKYFVNKQKSFDYLPK